MNLNIATSVTIQDGVGEFDFPQALKRDLLTSTIYCQSLYLKANTSADNEGLFFVCDGSYYITRNGGVEKNVLAMFQNKPATNTINFYDHKLPITSPQDKLRVEIVDCQGVTQKVSGLAVVGISGRVVNKPLAI